jgi:MscS family membrane protein
MCGVRAARTGSPPPLTANGSGSTRVRIDRRESSTVPPAMPRLDWKALLTRACALGVLALALYLFLPRLLLAPPARAQPRASGTVQGQAAAGQGGAAQTPAGAPSKPDPEHRPSKPSLLAPMQRFAEVVSPEGERRVDEGDEGSPRSAVLHYIDACREGRFGEAARYLDLPAEVNPRDAARSARRLKALLDRYQWLDLDRLSASPEGDLDDGLPGSIDEIARIPAPGGSEPIRLIRKFDKPGGRWLFTHRTVEVVDTLYAQLPNHGLVDRLPDALLAMWPLELSVWQWFALPVLLLLAFGAAKLLASGTLRLLRALARRTVTTWDDELVESSGGPITLLWAIACCDWLLPWLGLAGPAASKADRVLNASLAFSFFWIALRSVDVARTMLARGRYQAEPSAQAFLGFGARFAKLLVVLLAVVGVLSELGYPVGSLLAGLGLGGLAFALAAQKTVENLFGALSIGLDQPFHVGDYVRIDSTTEGTVETIGLRSTRIRTIDRTLVTLPNGRLAEMRAESFAARDRIRFTTTLQLVSQTSEPQLRAVLAGCRKLLEETPAASDDVRVHLVRLGDWSLDVEINAWLACPTWNEFLDARQELLLALLKVVAGAGTRLAYPTRVIADEGSPQRSASEPAKAQ